MAQARSVSEVPRDREFDTLLASLLLASLVLHFGFVLYLQRTDWPREPDVPDQYWHLLPPRAPVFAEPRREPAPKPAPGRSVRRVGKQQGKQQSAQPGNLARAGRLSLTETLGENPLAGLFPAAEARSSDAFDQLGGANLGGESRGPRVGSLEIGTNLAGDGLKVHGPGRVATGERGGERPVQPRVDIVDPPPTQVPGGLPVDQAIAVIRQHLGGIRACYQGPLNHHHELAGKITVRFTVEIDGSVGAITFEEDTLGSPEVASCVRGRVAGWHFPAASRPSQFSFPFVFQSAD
jgi:hypothetical protein